MRYGSEGYFWADKKDGTNVVYLGTSTEGTNRLNLQDGNGDYIVKETIEVAMSGGGFVDYVFPKNGETVNSPKRSYSKYYENFGWIIGTGNYTDTIDDLVVEPIKEMESVCSTRKTIIWIFLISGMTIFTIVSIIAVEEIRKSFKEAINRLAIMTSGDLTFDVDLLENIRKDEFR